MKNLLQKTGENKNFLSTTGNEVVMSKPEPSADILRDKRPLGKMLLQSKIELKASCSTPKMTENKIFVANNFSDEQKMEETSIPAIKLKENDNLQKMNHESFIKQEVINSEKEVPEGCNHYFGYLWSLPKGTATPDECYCCLKLIDCLKETKRT